MNNWILVFVIAIQPGCVLSGGPAVLGDLTQAECERIGKGIVAKWGHKAYSTADYVCIQNKSP
jgi:hypothetical protein